MNRLRARRHAVHLARDTTDLGGTEPLDWRHRAACLGEDSDSYVSANGTEPVERVVSGD